MILALDIGGTTTRFSLRDGGISGKVSAYGEFTTIYNYKDFLNRCVNINQQLPARPTSMGVSFGVSFGSDGDKVIAAGKMPDFGGRNLASDLEIIFACKCRAAHDCICALLAEHTHANHDNSLAYITASTGIGAAALIKNNNSQVCFRLRLAHTVVDVNGLDCDCGQRGCLATFTDSGQLERRVGQKLEAISDDAFWDQFAKGLAIGLVNLSWCFPIREITVGGGIILGNHKVRNLLFVKFQELRHQGNQPSCKLRMPHYGKEAPLLGAHLLAENKQICIIS